MPEVRSRPFLPALLGALHQERAEGELVLEQNDGVRTLYWKEGTIRYLRSDAVGEQFGNYLIRLGILDLAALQELLADGEGARMGDRVVQWGLMTTEERDARLQELLGSILTHAMEHTLISMSWKPGSLSGSLSGDLQFRLNHRALIWEVFQRIHNLSELRDNLLAEPAWRWKAKPDLLYQISDLPLNPKIAYALSLLGTEPLGYQTLMSITGLGEEEAAHIIVVLWALGGLTLTHGEMPLPPGLRKDNRMSSGPMRIPPTPTPTPAAKVTPPPPPPPQPKAPPLPPSSQSLPEMQVDFDIEMEDASEPERIEGMPQLELEVQEEPAPAPAAAVPAEEIAELSPELKARAFLKKAQSLLLQERASEAIRALEQSLKLDGDSPKSYEAWLLLGRLRLTNPAWSTRAIEALQSASRVNARAAEPWALMGELYHRKGFRANAQGCYKKALELDPSVQVPDDLVVEEPNPRASSPGGLMGRIKSILQRGD